MMENETQWKYVKCIGELAYIMGFLSVVVEQEWEDEESVREGIEDCLYRIDEVSDTLLELQEEHQNK